MNQEVTSIDVFHVGPPKTATTWVYRCFREHPTFSVTTKDAVHYYDMFHARGPDWYASQFVNWQPGLKRLDATPSYIQCRSAMERLMRENPNARFVVGLREPIERAFSHYWHLRKKGQIKHRFDEILDNYTLYSLWLEPGFIARNLRPLLDQVPREHIYPMSFETLNADPAGELRRLFQFCDVDADFRPSLLEKRVNVAGPRQTLLRRAAYKAGRMVFGGAIDHRGQSGLINWLSGKGEYHQGVDQHTLQRLRPLCEPEIREIESAFEVDLSEWRTRYELSAP